MDNRLYQQLSTGWTYRWQQILEYSTSPKFMWELSMLILVLVFINKMLSWGVFKVQTWVKWTCQKTNSSNCSILWNYVQYKVHIWIVTNSLNQTFIVVSSSYFSFVFTATYIRKGAETVGLDAHWVFF